MCYTVHEALFGSEMNSISVWLDWGKQGIIQKYDGGNSETFHEILFAFTCHLLLFRAASYEYIVFHVV